MQFIFHPARNADCTVLDLTDLDNVTVCQRPGRYLIDESQIGAATSRLPIGITGGSWVTEIKAAVCLHHAATLIKSDHSTFQVTPA